MPETDRAGKQTCAVLRRDRMPRPNPERSRPGTRWRPRPAGFSGCIAGIPATTTQQQPQAGKRRGAGERWRKSFSGDPLTTGCVRPHPVPRSNQPPLEVRELQASVSPAPFVVDPRRRPGDCIAILRLQIGIRCDRVDVKSSTASEHTAPRQGYFFFFAATLRLAGAFFFAAVFAFVAFFTILPSWPKPSGGVVSAPARIAGTALRLLQRKEKNIFHIKETCTGRPRAELGTAHSASHRDEAAHDFAGARQRSGKFLNITEMPAKWALLRFFKT